MNLLKCLYWFSVFMWDWNCSLVSCCSDVFFTNWQIAIMNSMFLWNEFSFSVPLNILNSTVLGFLRLIAVYRSLPPFFLLWS